MLQQDKDLLAPEHLFRLLYINDVSIIEGENRRGEDQVPTLKLGKSPLSVKYAAIDVTSEF